jgi:hypothetical protein
MVDYFISKVGVQLTPGIETRRRQTLKTEQLVLKSRWQSVRIGRGSPDGDVPVESRVPDVGNCPAPVSARIRPAGMDGFDVRPTTGLNGWPGMLATRCWGSEVSAAESASPSCETWESPVIIFDLTVRGCQERSPFCSRLDGRPSQPSIARMPTRPADPSPALPAILDPRSQFRDDSGHLGPGSTTTQQCKRVQLGQWSSGRDRVSDV